MPAPVVGSVGALQVDQWVVERKQMSPVCLSSTPGPAASPLCKRQPLHPVLLNKILSYQPLVSFGRILLMFYSDGKGGGWW